MIPLPYFCFLPRSKPEEDTMKNLSALKMGCLAATFCLAAAIASPAQTFKTLVNFDATNGAYPFAGLVQGTDGYFYGTTAYGGTNFNCSGSCGTVFKITAAGALTTLHSFGAAGGGGFDPQAPLVHAANGDFYGTTV
jgi:uncharacterized repeat protein (TIGR03803 family)